MGLADFAMMILYYVLMTDDGSGLSMVSDQTT